MGTDTKNYKSVVSVLVWVRVCRYVCVMILCVGGCEMLECWCMHLEYLRFFFFNCHVDVDVCFYRICSYGLCERRATLNERGNLDPITTVQKLALLCIRTNPSLSLENTTFKTVITNFQKHGRTHAFSNRPITSRVKKIRLTVHSSFSVDLWSSLLKMSIWR